MKDTSTFTLFLDTIKRHQLRQPLKAALAVVPSLAFAVRPRQPQKHVVPALCFERKEKVRHNHQTILTLSYISTSTISRNTEKQNEPGRLAHLFSMLTVYDTCQQPLTMTFSNVCQPPQLLKAFVPTSAPDDICMQNAAKHASLEPPQKPPPTTWNFNGQTS